MAPEKAPFPAVLGDLQCCGVAPTRMLALLKLEALRVVARSCQVKGGLLLRKLLRGRFPFKKGPKANLRLKVVQTNRGPLLLNGSCKPVHPKVCFGPFFRSLLRRLSLGGKTLGWS